MLCWLATLSKNGAPNVNPKSAWLYREDDRIWVADIASPKTVANIRYSPKVCLSFVDALTQKGYKIVGKARILETGDEGFDEAFDKLTAYIGGKFPIPSVIEISVELVAPIKAPKCILLPETPESEMVQQALKSYGLEWKEDMSD